MFFEKIDNNITEQMIRKMEVEMEMVNQLIEKKRLRLEAKGTNEPRKSFTAFPCGD